MDTLWQNVVIASAVALAVAYLVFFYLRRRKDKVHCKDCQRLMALRDPGKDASI
jgi:hypothetical protein